MSHTLITSRSNPWVQQWLRYHTKPSARKAAGLVWLEGEHLALEALKQCAKTASVFVKKPTNNPTNNLATNPTTNPVNNFSLPRFEIVQWLVPHTAAGQSMAEKLQALASINKQTGIETVYLAESVYKALCSMDSLPSVCVVLRESEQAQIIDYTAPAVVLDGLQDPGNIGTAIRLCAAFGMPQVLLSTTCASSWSAKALRAGQGAQLSVNVHENLDLKPIYQGFKAHNMPIWATSLANSSVSLARLTANNLPKNMVWVFGNEGQGIGAESQAAATQCVHIPMQGGFESLNVGSAVAICLWAWQQHS